MIGSRDMVEVGQPSAQEWSEGALRQHAEAAGGSGKASTLPSLFCDKLAKISAKLDSWKN